MLLVLTGFLLPATFACLYYAVLTALGWRAKPPCALPDPPPALAVVIPAHDEADGLPNTLRSVLSQGYPRDRLRVVVIADNCTDRTAAVARGYGAEVIERTDLTLRGKGHALEYALPRVLAGRADAVVLLDADCELGRGTLAALAGALAAGANAAQSAVRYGPRGVVPAVGAELDSAVGAGLAALGGSAPLRGTGMAFRREALELVPWRAVGLAEDAEYGVSLRRAGVRVASAPGAVVTSQPPPTPVALTVQRKRWRAALSVPGRGPLDRALSSKPLVVAHLLATVLASAGAWWAGTGPVPLAWACGLVAVTAWVYGRAILRAGTTGSADWPEAVVTVARLSLVAGFGAARPPVVWERTPRMSEVGG